MRTATQLMQRSEAANAVHRDALRQIDLLERATGPIRYHERADLYRRNCLMLIDRNMRAELDPWLRAAARLQLLTLDPEPQMPPQLRELADSITARWLAVAAQLLGDPS